MSKAAPRQPWAAPRPIPRLERAFWHIASFMLLCAVWEVSARSMVTLLVPSASETFRAAMTLVLQRELWRAFWVSNQAVLFGFAAAACAGTLTGMALGRFPTLARWLDLHMQVSLAVPKMALIPLIVIIFGFGLASRTIVIFVFAYPVIAVTVQAGLQTIDQRLISMARVFCASERQIWWRILLPGARPAIVTGLRLGLARAVTGMVSVEITLVAVGLGRLLLQFRADFDAASLYATVFFIVGEAILLMRLTSALERRTGSFDRAAVAG